MRTVQTDELECLLQIGEAGGLARDWPDYPEDFGLDERHIPALIRLACDGALLASDSDVGWAPVHAWRALGQLRAAEAAGPLAEALASFNQDASDLELPIVLGMIGAAAISPLARLIANRKSSPLAGSSAMQALAEIARRHPAHRDACVDVLLSVLRPRAGTDPVVAGFAVCSLLDLQAVETIEVVRDAYRRGAIDVSLPGDLEDAEIALGVREARCTPQPRYDHAPGVSPALVIPASRKWSLH